MLSLLVICLLFLLIALFLHDASYRGITKTLLSHYWYFSLLWFIAFPLRAVFIEFDFVDIQSGLTFSSENLVYAMFLAFAYWASVTAGYLSVGSRYSVRMAVRGFPRRRYIRASLIVLIALALGMYFLSEVVVWEELRTFAGNEQNEARVGHGLFFLTAELFVFAIFPLFGLALADQRNRTAAFPFGKFLLILVLGFAAAMTVAIASRRVIASILFGIVLVYLVKERPKSTVVPFLIVTGSVLVLPLLQILRYVDLAEALSGEVGPIEIFAAAADPRFVLTIISSSLEGVDHVAKFVEMADISGIFLGVDGGMSWVFNAFMAYVPRFIWPTKPLLYGSVAQQHFLYPEMYDNGAATTTLPPSFVVDFSFGFGILFGLLMAFFLGRFFAVCGNALWSRSTSPAGYTLALFAFVNVFNIVRGGTGFLLSLVLLALLSCAALGFGDTTKTLKLFLREVIGIASGKRDEQLGDRRASAI